MIEKMADDMSAWAAARGLSYLGERELPPQTTFLRYGLGVGEVNPALTKSGVSVSKSFMSTIFRQDPHRFIRVFPLNPEFGQGEGPNSSTPLKLT